MHSMCLHIPKFYIICVAIIVQEIKLKYDNNNNNNTGNKNF